MNLRPNDRQDADDLDATALDAFWDELVLGQNAPQAGTPEEELVMNLQQSLALDDSGAESRLQALVFGSAPHASATAAPMSVFPRPKPEPTRPARHYAQWAAAALAVLLVGALVAAQNAGIFGSRGGNDAPTAIPAAVAQVDATPAALASPTTNDSAILWTLPFDGTNAEIGATALANGVLYRLIHSDEFTGVQAVDTATGAEQWRSDQDWSGNGLGADANGVYFPTPAGVRAISIASGDQLWDVPTIIAPRSLTVSNGRVYLWDGVTSLMAIDTADGATAWKGEAGIQLFEGRAAASQPPVASENGIAAVSGNRVIVLFDPDGNWITNIGNFDPFTVEMALADPSTLIFAGNGKVNWESEVEPYERQLVSVDLATGSINWQTDYNALVTGLTVTDTMALVLADNPGLAIREVQLVDAEGTVTTEQTNPYPAQTSPQIFGYFLDTGQWFQDPEDTTAWNATGRTWIADPGNPPFVALAQGPNGPIGISASGRMSFFSTENSLVQAVVTLPEVLPTQIVSNGAAVYASTADGSLTAVAPVLANLEPQPVNLAGNIDWTMPLDGQLVDFGGMAYAEGLVYRLIDAGAGPQIEATYAATGQPAWSLPFAWSTDQLVADPGPDPNDPEQTWTGSGNIFAVDAENRLIAIDGATGALAWQHAFAAPVVSMIYDADTLYIWDESGTMTALLPQDGMVIWETTPGTATGPQSNDLGMPIPAVTRTTIAMLDADGTLHAFGKELGDPLWSTPGFDGTNARLTRQGNAAWDQTEVFVVVSAQGAEQEDGTFDQTVSGVLADTGERIWDSAMQGPLVQPVSADETLLVVTANQLNTGKNVPVDSTPIVDGEPFNHYVWTGTGETAPTGGGQRLFALQADTGELVWIRTTATGGFTDLFTKFPTGGGSLYAITSDGLLVSPNRGNGAIDAEPTALGGPVLATTSSNETGAIGSFATLADGALVAFGGLPFSQQG